MSATIREFHLEDALTEAVVGAAYEVSNVLGAGFLEKVYQRALLQELAIGDIPASTDVSLPVHYKGHLLGNYSPDLMVDGRLVVELKCVDHFAPEHLARCLNYPKASHLPLALLINFQRPKVEWKRIVLTP
ncbi:MAG: GxxExxY protein [Acidobacteria bacterium]|jgi:GxxExxY protein|nr:GxxExxY protein [Acidobacteriota bacterium]